MCPAASRPPRSICHFVRPHKDATRSCVEGLGKGIGCLMDIPEASTSGCFCFVARFSEFMFGGRPVCRVSDVWGKLVEEHRKWERTWWLIGWTRTNSDVDCSNCSSLFSTVNTFIEHRLPSAHAYLLSRHTNWVFFIEFLLPAAFFLSLVHNWLILSHVILLLTQISWWQTLLVLFLILQTKFLACQEKAPHTAQLQIRWAYVELKVNYCVVLEKKFKLRM